jgi:hypothetical protein
MFQTALLVVMEWCTGKNNGTVFCRLKGGVVNSNPVRGTDVCVLCMCVRVYMFIILKKVL